MRGKHRAKKREILPDAKYHSILVAKFINKIMWQGKKVNSHNIVYNALAKLEEKTKEPALDSFIKVIDSVKPLLEVKSKRIGGATYQVPMEVPADRAQTLAMRWIIQSARGKKGKTMTDKLSEELLSAYHKEGGAMRKRANVHQMAEANKAFAHYARF